MHKVHTQYMQRWRHLYSQASEQSSDTNIVNQQVTINFMLLFFQKNDVTMC